MVRTTFLTIFIILWLVVATFVGVLALIAAFRRRRRQASASSPTVLPTGLTSTSRGSIGG